MMYRRGAFHSPIIADACLILGYRFLFSPLGRAIRYCKIMTIDRIASRAATRQDAAMSIYARLLAFDASRDIPSNGIASAQFERMLPCASELLPTWEMPDADHFLSFH